MEAGVGAAPVSSIFAAALRSEKAARFDPMRLVVEAGGTAGETVGGAARGAKAFWGVDPVGPSPAMTAAALDCAQSR